MLSQSSVTIAEGSLKIDGVPEESVIALQAVSTTPSPPLRSDQRPNAIRRFSEHLTHSITNFRQRMAGLSAARRMTLSPEEVPQLLRAVSASAKEAGATATSASRVRDRRTVRDGRWPRGRDGDSKASSDYQPITDLLAIMSATTAFPAPRSGARLREMLPRALWLPNHLRDLHKQNQLRDLHMQNQLRDLQVQESSHLQEPERSTDRHSKIRSCSCFKIIHPYSYFRFIAGFDPSIECIYFHRLRITDQSVVCGLFAKE